MVKSKELFWIICSLISNSSLVWCNDEYICPSIVNNNSHSLSDLRHHLYLWCSQDKDCSHLYHQSYRKNETIFNHLIKSQLNEASFYQPLEKLLCNGYSLEEVNRLLWLLIIKSNHDVSRPICDVNHKLVFYENDLRFECICKSDKICTDGLFDLTPFYLVLAFITVLGAMIAVGILYKEYRLLYIFEKVTNRSDALKALSTNLT